MFAINDKPVTEWLQNNEFKVKFAYTPIIENETEMKQLVNQAVTTMCYFCC